MATKANPPEVNPPGFPGYIYIVSPVEFPPGYDIPNHGLSTSTLGQAFKVVGSKTEAESPQSAAANRRAPRKTRKSRAEDVESRGTSRLHSAMPVKEIVSTTASIQSFPVAGTLAAQKEQTSVVTDRAEPEVERVVRECSIREADHVRAMDRIWTETYARMFEVTMVALPHYGDWAAGVLRVAHFSSRA